MAVAAVAAGSWSCSQIATRPVFTPQRLSRLTPAAVRAVQAPPSTPSSKEARVEALWTWLRDNGITGASVRPALVAEGLGLVAQKEVADGAEVLAVPSSLWINAALARGNKVVGRLCEGQKPWICIALLLLHEKSQPNSKWRPYLDILPDVLDSPLFWTDEELAELQGTQLLATTLGYVQYVKSEYEKLTEELSKPGLGSLDPQGFSLDALMWTFGILRSRTFAPLTGDDLALVPFADLVNHAAGLKERSSWEKKSAGLFSQQSLLTVRAGSYSAAGEQVFIQYGKDKSNAQLALDYGFVEREVGLNGISNSIRDKFTLTLEILESDRFFDDKSDICEVNGMQTTMYFDLLPGERPPEDMLAFLRLTVVSGPDAFHLEALFRNAVWGHLQYPISRENEEAVCRSILDGCTAALAGYATTIEEDVDLLNSSKLSTRHEVATVVRLGEKRVLRELQMWSENRVADLDKLEYYAERRLRDLGLVDDIGDVTPWVFNE